MQKEPSRHILKSELGPSVESHIAWYHYMQETQPVRYRPEYNLWEVFSYKEVQQVLLDYTTFSVDKCVPEGFPGALGISDPPEYLQIRNLVSKAFTPRSIEELTPRLIQIVDELLEGASTSGKMNVATEFAHRLPGRVITEILGLPLEDQERFQQWATQLYDQLVGIGVPNHTEMLQYFSNRLHERKCDPRDDLMSELLAAKENGAHVTHEEIVHLCLDIMMAANATVPNLLTCTLQHFCRHPETYQTLRNDPSLIPGAIEETLRCGFNMMNAWRTTRHDTMLGGQEIKAGQYVVAWVGAANFDETYFPQASRFDIRRSPNPHLTFGYGAHVCLGSALARLEGRIALERIITHFSDIRPDLGKPLQLLDNKSKYFRVLLTPAASSASFFLPH